MLILLNASDKHTTGKGVHWEPHNMKRKDLVFFNKLMKINLIN